MSIKSLRHEGRTYANITPEELAEFGVPEEVITAAIDHDILGEAVATLDQIMDGVFTSSPSQAERYAQKFAEAVRYAEAGYPGKVSPADYPFLVAEAAVRGISKRQQADSVIAAGRAFQTLGAAAESTRVTLAGAIAQADGAQAKRIAAQTILENLKAGIAAQLGQ